MLADMPISTAVGAGYDDVDAKAAAAAGINVSNTPGAVDNATATTCVFLIIAALRKYLTSEKHARNGKWCRARASGYH
jgi:lactate dehydrogenase-like 2-hydroxyacid dehydrogenase